MKSDYFKAFIFPRKEEWAASICDDKVYHVERKLMAEVVNMQDQVLIDGIVRAAQEAGVSHLYLLDKAFIVEAIQEKLERLDNSESSE